MVARRRQHARIGRARWAERPDLLPSLGIVLGGVLWGLFWLPVRAFGEMGLAGAWAGLMIYAGAAVALLPVALLQRRSLLQRWRPLAVCGLFTGAAFSFYATSLLLTDVVRAILLFYLTPVWGTLLGVIVLEERLTVRRACALVLGIGGLLVVLGIGSQMPFPRNLGDWLALLSGMAWAYGTLALYQMGSVAVAEQLLVFVGGSLLVTLAGLALGGAAFGGAVDPWLLGAAFPWALLAALYVVPMLWLTIWPATLLTPGRIGLLLMGEVVVGVASAAVLTGEPFGAREAFGTVLIVTAGLVEVLERNPVSDAPGQGDAPARRPK